MRTLNRALLGFITFCALAVAQNDSLDRAALLCRQARDSGDAKAYDQAGAAIDAALKLAPTNHEAMKLRIVVLLGRHDFASALAQARELNRKVPDDIAVWGYLADANLGLGEYIEAVKDAQWILDLRRGSTLGYTKAAVLREFSGDNEGASRFYDEALLRTSRNDLDEQAWLLTRNARLQLAMGNGKRSRALLTKALTLHPGSQLALATLAALNASEGKFDDAVALYRQRVKSTPLAGALYDLAVMLDRTGQAAEAETVFREFESKARAEMGSTLNDNRDLIFYYADRRNAPSQALELAAREAAKRHDPETLDAYAWALFRSGKFAEAQIQIERALAPGVREASYFCHALRIAQARQDQAAVQRFEKELTGMQPCECAAPAESTK